MNKRIFLSRRRERSLGDSELIEDEIKKLSLKDVEVKDFLTKRELRRWKMLPRRQRNQYIENAKINYYLKLRAQHKEDLSSNAQVRNFSNEPTQQNNQLRGVKNSYAYKHENNKKQSTVKGGRVDKKSSSDIKLSGNEVLEAGRQVSTAAFSMAEGQMRQEEHKEQMIHNQEVTRMVADDFKKQVHTGTTATKGILTLAFPELKVATAVVVPIIIAAIIGILAIAVMIAAAFGVMSENNANSGKRIVEVAIAEEELGLPNGGEKYWSWYGFGNRVEWCATFVSWCANQLDYIEQGIIPKSASVSGFRQWYDRKGMYLEKGSYTPKAGDLIIFLNGMSHVGIVQYVKGAQVVTIEGNTGDKVATRTYPLDYSAISGYCTPEYPESESNFTGDSNAEVTWNFLISKGCSPHTAAGIMGNLQQESGMDPTKAQGGGGPGRGIAQWEITGNRYQNLLRKANEMGMEWTDIRVQLEFLWWELSGGETTCKAIMNRDYGGFENFKNATDIRWATLAFEKSYERAGKPMMEKRYQYAESFYDQYAMR